ARRRFSGRGDVQAVLLGRGQNQLGFDVEARRGRGQSDPELGKRRKKEAKEERRKGRKEDASLLQIWFFFLSS
ncbi:hypothetical protein PJI17_32305, partial [Mycobacterium kansasii]